MAYFCEYGSETPGPVKAGNFLALLKKSLQHGVTQKQLATLRKKTGK
jgi:hypothetical protein